MYRAAATALIDRPIAELSHGTFNDGITAFVVRSTTTVPDVVRVHALTGDPADYWVVVLTGVRSPNVDATWCGRWNDRSITWKAGLTAWTFYRYFNGTSKPLTAAERTSLLRGGP